MIIDGVLVLIIIALVVYVFHLRAANNATSASVKSTSIALSGIPSIISSEIELLFNSLKAKIDAKFESFGKWLLSEIQNELRRLIPQQPDPTSTTPTSTTTATPPETPPTTTPPTTTPPTMTPPTGTPTTTTDAPTSTAPTSTATEPTTPTTVSQVPAPTPVQTDVPVVTDVVQPRVPSDGSITKEMDDAIAALIDKRNKINQAEQEVLNAEQNAATAQSAVSEAKAKLQQLVG